MITISPTSGTYTSGQQITLSADVAGTQIVYTLDGSEPDITGWMLDDAGQVIIADNGQPIILDGV